jgi:hypothetical protein
MKSILFLIMFCIFNLYIHFFLKESYIKSYKNFIIFILIYFFALYLLVIL